MCAHSIGYGHVVLRNLALKIPRSRSQIKQKQLKPNVRPLGSTYYLNMLPGSWLKLPGSQEGTHPSKSHIQIHRIMC